MTFQIESIELNDNIYSLNKILFISPQLQNNFQDIVMKYYYKVLYFSLQIFISLCEKKIQKG